MAAQTDADDAQPDFDPTDLAEGDELTVSYVSTYGNNPTKTFVGIVDDVEVYGVRKSEDDPTFVPVRVEATLVVPDETRNTADHYTDVRRTKRVEFMLASDMETWESYRVETRNGYRWSRLSRLVTKPTVSLNAQDDDADESVELVTDGGQPIEGEQAPAWVEALAEDGQFTVAYLSNRSGSVKRIVAKFFGATGGDPSTAHVIIGDQDDRAILIQVPDELVFSETEDRTTKLGSLLGIWKGDATQVDAPERAEPSDDLVWFDVEPARGYMDEHGDGKGRSLFDDDDSPTRLGDAIADEDDLPDLSETNLGASQAPGYDVLDEETPDDEDDGDADDVDDAFTDAMKAKADGSGVEFDGDDVDQPLAAAWEGDTMAVSGHAVGRDGDMGVNLDVLGTSETDRVRTLFVRQRPDGPRGTLWWVTGHDLGTLKLGDADAARYRVDWIRVEGQ